MNSLYEGLPDAMQRSVDTLLEFAGTALWPERRAALQQLREGIARSGDEECRKVLKMLGADVSAHADPSDLVYRVLLTAFLQRLGDIQINNPDQAYLLGQSLDDAHLEATRGWLLDNPDYAKA